MTFRSPQIRDIAMIETQWIALLYYVSSLRAFFTVYAAQHLSWGGKQRNPSPVLAVADINFIWEFTSAVLSSFPGGWFPYPRYGL